ncbi:hypothetical protein INT45_012014 [Circinella minor]|uniref:Uncharacterized protein n=1 Tax=Circinella minor TaxID=1195481 RepID=A0A8H7VP92_9FUNG|nr:hypothetical protein INT45_012014 [Circinella minor]
MPSNAEKLKSLCDETLTGFDGTIPYAYNGRPQFGTFQLPLEVVRHAPELQFDDSHMGSNWMAIPPVAKLNRQRLKIRHHVVDDPNFIPPKKNRQIVPPTRGGVKLRDVNTIIKEQEEIQGMSEEQIRRYRESKRHSSPQRRLHQQQQLLQQQKAVNPVQDILNEITAASVPRSTPPSSSTTNNNHHKNINSNSNNNNSQRNRGPLGHRATSSDSSSSSNSTPSRNHHTNNQNNSRGTTSTAASITKKSVSKIPSSTTTINSSKRKSQFVPDLLVTKIHLLDTNDIVETRKIAGLKRLASAIDMHRKQDNIVTKRPRLLLHLGTQQVVEEERKKIKIAPRDKIKTSKTPKTAAANNTDDVNFVPNIKATDTTPTTNSSTTGPKSNELSPKPTMTNGYKPDVIKDISEKRSSKSDSIVDNKKRESPLSKIEKSSTHRNSSSSNAEFLKSTRIPKRKPSSSLEDERPRSINTDRELEEGETISPSPSPREPPPTLIKPEHSSSPGVAVVSEDKEKERRKDRSLSPPPPPPPSSSSSTHNKERTSTSNGRSSSINSRATAVKREEERTSSSSSSKRSSRRNDDVDDRRRSDRRDNNNNNNNNSSSSSRLRTDDEDKKRRSDDRVRDRSVDDRKRHRRDSRQSSITSSERERQRRRSRSPPSTSKHSSSSLSRTYKNARSRSPRPAKSRSRSPRARSHSSTRRSSIERERRTSSSSSSTIITKEVEQQKPPAPIYKNATSSDSETEQQCKMYAFMFRKLATAYKHRGDPRTKEIIGLIDHMHAILNYVLSFYYQDKKPDKYQSLAHWESLYPFASIVMRNLQQKREMQLYAVCAHVLAMVRFYTFRRREMVANKKLEPLISDKPQEASPIKATVAHDAARGARQALTDFEEAYKLYKEGDKHMNQEQFKEQFPDTQKAACDKGEYGPGIVIGGEAGITIEPRYPFVPFAKLHHAAIVAKCVLHEYLQKNHLAYTPISDTDEFM